MKSEIRGCDSVKPKTTYPCLKKARNTGRIVLFIRQEAGMQVNDDCEGLNQVGYYFEGWAEEDFELLPEGCEVVLSND